MPEPNAEQQIRESWHQNAAAWTRAVRSGSIRSRAAGTDAAIVNVILAHAPVSALDIGCGEGWLCRRLVAAGVRVVGFDGSPELIASAHVEVGADYQVLNYDTFSEAPNSIPGTFDVVVFNFALLGQNIEAVLRAATAKLPADGVIVIQTVHPWITADGHYEDGWRLETFAGFETGFKEPMPWYYRTLSSWVSELAAAELSLVELHEPLNPEDARPLSLILVCKRNRRSG
jgi:2-polyprenyl-3-methyl-5-hydroxy-6-metoxy-1,4-benzoquinol methylase